jgi:Tfp pilus assembly protein PilF
MLKQISRSVLILAAFFLLGINQPAWAQKPAAKKNLEQALQYKEEGSLFQAKESLQKALEIDPGFHTARVELAGVYADLNMLDEAADELAKLKKVSQPLPRYHSYQGLVNYKQGLETWTKLVQNHPEYMYKDDGTVQFIKKGVSPEAQVDKLEKKIEKDTTQFEARYQLRGMYYDVAIAELVQAVKQAPKDTLANLTLGLTYLERGKKDLVLKQKQALEKIDPQSAKDLQAMMDFVEQGKKELEEDLNKDNM